MFDIQEVHFNEKVILITQNDVDFELRTILVIKNHSDQKQSNEWDVAVYFRHGGDKLSSLSGQAAKAKKSCS